MRIFYLLILSCFALFKLDAQIDTSFWFAAPKVPAPLVTTSVGLQFGSYTTAATVFVRQPANPAGVNFSFTIPANTSTVVNMTPSVALFVNTTPNVVNNLGLYISSTGSISVNYIMDSPTSKENISLKGRFNGTGTDFYAPFTNSLNTLYNGVAGNTGFDIIATESGVTSLLITPRGNLVGPHAKNVPFIVNLNQGQAYSCQEALFTRQPIEAVSKDFNGDGNLDIAMIDFKYNTVFILRGNGNGTFSEFGTYTVAAGPVQIIADDVNNDSNQDLIVVNNIGDNVSVLLGNGAAAFTYAGNFLSGGNGASGVACSDLNGDGNKDLVVTNQLSFSFGVLFGNGTGSFTLNNTYVTPQQPMDIKISDFTNDGNKDVIVTNFGANNISRFNGTALGTFTSSANFAVGTNPYRILVQDLNADGNEDLVIAQRGSNNVRVMFGDAVGGFPSNASYAVGSQPESICLVNINGDAFMDIAVANAGANNVSILLGAAAGVFGAATNNAVSTTPRGIVAGDFNGNGQQDLATANFNGNNYSVLMGNGTSAMTAASNVLLGTTFYPNTELGGSIISADKKISVSISGAVASNSVCNSYYSDQITPADKIGMYYVVHRTGTASDQAYIVAPTNATSFTITGATTLNGVMNASDVYRVVTSGSPLTFIQTDKPVYVMDVGGSGCRLSAAQIAPAYCAGSYTASFERESSDSLFLDVYIRPAGIGTFTLDINGTPTPIAAGLFTVVPGSSGNLFGARIYYNTATMPQGAYCILRNNVDLFGFSVQNGSNAGGSHLSHHSNFTAQTFVKAHPVATATICTNTSLSLNGVVGGGPNTGVWSTTGSGSFSGGPNALINTYVPNLNDTLLKPTPLPLGWTGGSVNIILTTTGICPNLSDFVGVRILQGPIVNAGPDQIKCTNNATINLNGSVLGASSQGTWAVTAPGSGTFSNPLVLATTYTPSNADTALTSLQFVLTSINNGICAAGTDVILVNFQKAPLVDAAPSANTVACANNATVYLNGYISNSIPTGIWSTSGSGVFIPNNISLTNYYIPSLTDISNGPIKIKLTTPPGGLCKAVSDSVFVFFTQPDIISAGSDLNSCKNNPVINLNATITGTNSSNVSWSGGTGTFVPSNTVLSPTYIATATEIAAGFAIITVSTTNNGICASVNDQVRVDFRDKPTAAFNAATVCLNTPTQFNDQSINPSGIGFLNAWAWDFGNGQNSSLTSPGITYTAPGTYPVQLIVSNSFGCKDTLTKQYTVYPLPNVKFGYSRSCTGSAQNICFTDSSTILPPSSLPTTNHYWDFGGVGFSVTKDTCFIFPTDGKYSVTHQVTSNDGCVASVVQTINITPKPDARFRFSILTQNLGLSTDVQFIDSSKYAVGIFWDFGNGATSTQTNPVNAYTENGTYTVTQVVTDQFGCTDSYTLEVRILNIPQEISLLIPNIISPNGDGKNDYWRLDFIDIFFPKAEIEIFNRWGESIFKSVGYSNAWDGTYRGNALPVGAYYYTLDLKDPKKPGVIKGNITLLK